MAAPAPLSAADPQTANLPRHCFGEPRVARRRCARAIFFSRTDAHGVILWGSEILRRMTDHA